VSAVLWQPPGSPHVAREWFATMHDVYVLVGEVPEDPGDCATADGRPATKPFAHARLARLYCADTEEFSLSGARRLARDAAQAQETEVVAAVFEVIWQLGEYPKTFILSGSGEFLARRVANRYDHVARIDGKGMTPFWYRCTRRQLPPGTRRPRQIWLSARLGAACSSAACAYAVAVLAAERDHGQ
jgi:hypothetical protein